MQGTPPQDDELVRRLEQLEFENQRLRNRLEKSAPMGATENPCFDPVLFGKAFGRMSILINIPAHLGGAMIMLLAFLPMTRGLRIGPIPFFDMGGLNSRVFPSLGLGIFASGALSIGFVAYGGLAIGVIAVGGGAIGIIAIGGGAVGLIAFGCGAVGVVAIGGGAAGHYALASRARGNHVLALNRQDPQAVEFFGRWIPGIRAAVTMPMPVILLSTPSSDPTSSG